GGGWGSPAKRIFLFHSVRKNRISLAEGKFHTRSVFNRRRRFHCGVSRPGWGLPRKKNIPISLNKDNPVALKLYEKKGFTATGAEDEDEIELAMTL
ncbi:MAG: hypothetical protein II135_11775, partial [Clostridia bacterium]|nr:hypothetical protein [Clostridia bacterium]